VRRVTRVAQFVRSGLPMGGGARKRTRMKGKEPRPKAGDRGTFEVESLLPAGEGAAGRVRITGAFPGERVVARVDHVGKHATFATTLEVERGRAGRRVPPCLRHRDLKDGRCTGCALMALDESDQRTLLRETLLAQHGLESGEVVAAPQALGYRWSAKRIAFGGPGKLRLGSFMRGTNRPADMNGCLVDHPLIAAAADELAEAARDLGIAAHDEERRRLGLRAVWLRTNGTQVLATLVTSEADEKELVRLSPRLTRCDGVAFSFHRDGGNALRGAEATALRGIEALDVHGTRIGPLGFLQPNPEAAEQMYDHLVDGISGGRVLDLYAGSGATTRRLRAFGGEVVPCESHPEGASNLGIEAETAEVFLARQSAGPDAVVANPPRKGLGAAVTQELLRLRPARIHAMACGPAGLVADIAALAQAYRLESLRAYDTLPQTPHVELIAKLVRIEEP
jgi:23S rRNA (uracil1939-C5)-methyltransferase